MIGNVSMLYFMAINTGDKKNGFNDNGTRKKKKRFVRDIQMRRKRL